MDFHLNNALHQGNTCHEKRKRNNYLNYDTTYSVLHQIVNYYEFIMRKFSSLLDPVLRLVDSVLLTPKNYFKYSRILQTSNFIKKFSPPCYLIYKN